VNDVRNPYSPPAARVSGAATGASESRPTAVNLALLLIGLETLLSAAGVLGDLRKFDFSSNRLIELTIGVLDVVFAIVLYVTIARGHNWARIVFLVLWMISLIFLGSWIYTPGGAPAGVHYVISWTAVASTALPHLLSLCAVVLLFGPGRAWFRDRGTATN
jgi:hypothetical protein